MVLLGLFLVSGSSTQVRIERGGSTTDWIMGTLARTSVWGCQWLHSQNL